MKASDLPTAKFPIPWASAAIAPYIRDIPTNSQIGIQDGAASLHDGYVPLNFTPRASGGVPPFGSDSNGILKQITLWLQWMQAGGTIPWDSTFSAAIAGYPKGCIVESAVTTGIYWRSTSDDNVTNPDASGAGWVQVGSISVTEITAGSGNFTAPAGARWLLAEFCGGGGGGGTGDGGSGGSSGTASDGASGVETVFNGIHAAPGVGGVGGRTIGGVYGGAGGIGGAGSGPAYTGQSGSPGTWVTTTGAGTAGGVGGSSLFGGGGLVNGSGFVAAGYGGGGGGGQTGQSGSFSGGGGGGAQSRRILILNPTGVYAYSVGGAGAGGSAVGNFPGSSGGGGYIRITAGF